MCLFVDSRVGSVDLLEPLRKAGLPVEATTLAFADFAFIGRGPLDKPLNIGIERKRLSDLVQSIRSGRLSGHQLPGLLGPQGAYEYAWLVVEGLYRVDAQGRILVKQKKRRGRGKPEWVQLPGGMLASEMEKQVLTFELCGGCHVKYTNSAEDTVHFLESLYRWFTDKAMDEHKAHLAPQRVSGPIALSGFRDTVRAFPGIGLRASLAVETHFQGSLVRAINASTTEWSEIATLDKKGKPKCLGTTVATKIHDFLRGEIL